jgi:hypothetical protein
VGSHLFALRCHFGRLSGSIFKAFSSSLHAWASEEWVHLSGGIPWFIRSIQGSIACVGHYRSICMEVAFLFDQRLVTLH